MSDCFHCDGSGRCKCPMCSPGYEIHDGAMRVAEGDCIAPHDRRILDATVAPTRYRPETDSVHAMRSESILTQNKG